MKTIREEVHLCHICEYFINCPNCRPCVECGAYKDKCAIKIIELDVDDDVEPDSALPF